MEFGNIYEVFYKEYADDLNNKIILVFAHNEKECREKVMKSGLIQLGYSCYDNNAGYISLIRLEKKNIL